MPPLWHRSQLGGRCTPKRTAALGNTPNARQSNNKTKTHLQPPQRLLPLHHLGVALLGRQVARHEEAQHAQRGGVDPKVLQRLLQVRGALAACRGDEG